MSRINALRAAERMQDLFNLRALDMHPLTGDRAGQFTIRLTGRMRLILTAEGDRRVMVEEVVDYHD